jgi:predicted RNA-binding protein with PUA-like domain
MNYWLFKSEPDVFSIQHLAKLKKQTSVWDGVRNYQARNYMRDGTKPGDLLFFYHSSCPQPGVAGIAEIASTPYPDPTQFNPESEYYDPKATQEIPRWISVDVKLKEIFDNIVPLSDLRLNPKLEDFVLLQRASRLSIIPVTAAQWKAIMAMR